MDYGIDVSRYNAIADASAVRAADITFAWVKATQGVDYVDPTFINKITQLRAVGIIVGAYHFFDASGDAVAQARHFRQVAGSAGCLTDGALMPMADLENAGVRGSANATLATFYDMLDAEPVDCYGNLDWWANVLRPADWGSRAVLGHIARYNGNPGNPGWSGYDRLAVHQHSESATVPGIPGAVDRNATIGTYNLAQLVIGGQFTPTPPTPTPAPLPPGVGDNTWVVAPGDTLSRIASAWNVTVSALAAANGIADPDLIRIGEVVHRPGSAGAGPAPAPSGATYVVRPSDTLSGIAASHATSVPILTTLNHISNPDRIYAGQVINLPTPGPATPPVTRVYIVQHGDTLSAIAAHLGYPGGYPALAARNGITPPKYMIFPGQQIHY